MKPTNTSPTAIKPPFFSYNNGFTQNRFLYNTVIATSIVTLLMIITSFPELDRKSKSVSAIEAQSIRLKPHKPVKTLSLLGEHNSGTTWTLYELKKCFEHKLEIKNRLTRHKHWFQHDDGKEHNQTLVIAQFRSPYHWVSAMMDKPRRSPAHRDMDWKTFVTTPWTMEREASDHQYKNETGRVCKENFKYDEIVSCASEPLPGEYKFDFRTDVRTPWYELRNDGSGRPYGSVLDLRSDKIKNHVLEVKTFPFVEDVIVVQYEELLSKGTEFMIRQIEEITGVEANCEPTPGQNRTQREVDPEMVQWMNKYLDWDAEALVRYKKW